MSLRLQPIIEGSQGRTQDRNLEAQTEGETVGDTVLFLLQPYYLAITAWANLPKDGTICSRLGLLHLSLIKKKHRRHVHRPVR